MVEKQEKIARSGLCGTTRGRPHRLAACALIVAALLLPRAAEAQEEPPQEEPQGEVSPASEAARQRSETQKERRARRIAERAAARRPERKDLEAPKRAVDDRLRFEVAFSEEEGGGSAVVFAEEVRQIEEIYQASGRVEVVYRDLRIRADQIDLDREKKTVVALGNVIVDQGPTRITGSTLEFDLDAETGKVTEARGYLGTDYYFAGESIEKTGEINYRIVDGIFSSCDQELPSWSIRTGVTNVTLDGFAKTKHARLQIKKVPVFYWPYLWWPVRAQRTSGFLVPQPGFSARRGSELGLAYYQTLGRSFDTTFYLDLSSEEYLGFGNEFRYQPTAGTSGLFEGYVIDDPVVGEVRWKVELAHRSDDLPFGMRGIVVIEDVSDFEFYRDFERRINNFSRRQLYSTAYLTGNWGQQSLNIVFDQRKSFLTVDEDPVVFRQLPELDYKLRSTRLGKTPLYLQGRASVSYLDIFRREDYFSQYYRAHFAPQIALPFRPFSWLSFNLTAGARLTAWGDSLRTRAEVRESEDGNRFRGESLSRLSPTVFLEIVGPSFSKIWDTDGKHFSKVKHLIEPRVSYFREPVFEEEDRIPLFDEIDLVTGFDAVRYSVINRFLAKPQGEEDSAREILSFEFFELYSLDPERPLQVSRDQMLTSQRGPLSLRIRFLPSFNTLLQIETRYSTLFSQIASNAVSGTFRLGTHNLGIRWSQRVEVESGETRQDQVSVSFRLSLWPDRLRLSGFSTYNLVLAEATNSAYAIDYTGSCWGMRLEYNIFRVFGREGGDRQIRFAISLKNIGTFFDMTTGGGTSSL